MDLNTIFISWRTQQFRYANSPQMIYTYNAIPIKIPGFFFLKKTDRPI